VDLDGSKLTLCAFVLALITGCGGATRSNADETESSGPGSDTTSTNASSTASGAGGTQSAETSTTGALPDAWVACSESSECTVTYAECCDDCPEATFESSIAVALNGLALYRQSQCSGTADCPPCLSIQDSYLRAVCVEGRCELVDIAATDIVKCSQPQDCVLRPTTCCQCDSWGDVIAINSSAEADYSELACDSTQQCSNTCAIDYTDIAPNCDGERCYVHSFL
jgi:hypothetical protein